MKFSLIFILLFFCAGCITYDKWVGFPDRIPQMEVCDKKEGRYYYEHLAYDMMQEIKEPVDKQEIDKLVDEFWK